MNKIVCGIITLIASGICCAGDLPPFELAGYKLGAYASVYDAEGVPGRRKLETPFCDFEEVEIKADGDRVGEIRLFSAFHDIGDSEREHRIDDCAKTVRSRLRNCQWKKADATRWRFTSHDATVSGFLTLHGDPPKLQYELVASIANVPGGTKAGRVGEAVKRSFGSINMTPYLSKVRPFPEPKTMAITNMFGVTLGMKLEDVQLNVKKLKTKNKDPWQYGFTPKKKFRNFETYKLRVKDGVVIGIRAEEKSKRGCSVDKIATIVDILRKKYNAAFEWPYGGDSSVGSTVVARHSGYGDDYTVLDVEFKSVRKMLSVDEFLSISLCLDVDRRQHDEFRAQMNRQQEKQKANADAHKYDGIDAL